MKILIFYSGGKDSQASLIWAIKEYGIGNCEAVFCDTGWENPVTYEHIKTTTEQLGVKLVTLKSNKYNGMIDLATQRKRFPSTMARFCTEELKMKPGIDYVLSHNENLIIIEGIRKNESLSRSKMSNQCTYFKYYYEPMDNGKKNSYRSKEVKEWCLHYNADKIRPIFNWTSQQTIDYIKDNGQTPNPLYYNGFKRVGCFPCIMARHGEIKRIIDYYPEQFDVLINAEKSANTNFFSPDYIPTHACKNKSYPTASEVKQYLLYKNATLDMFEEDTPSCMSAYNLCE